MDYIRRILFTGLCFSDFFLRKVRKNEEWKKSLHLLSNEEENYNYVIRALGKCPEQKLRLQTRACRIKRRWTLEMERRSRIGREYIHCFERKKCP